jgi:hypothetical protein
VNGFDKFNYSDIISNKAGDSSARGCSVSLSKERGNLRAVANRKACKPQSRRKAAVNALERLALDCAIPNLHPREVALNTNASIGNARAIYVSHAMAFFARALPIETCVSRACSEGESALLSRIAWVRV